VSSSSLLPICFDCARLRGVVPDVGWACEAFQRGIPTDILASVKDHREPYEGDGGLRFEPKSSEDSMPRLTTDPPVSEAQRRAMWAAKAGHSTLGIPSGVGSEFAEADPGGKLPEKVSKDMSGGNFKMLRWLLDKFMAEESEEPEHRGVDAKPDDDWIRRGRAASVAFTTSDGHVLLLRRGRDEENYPDAWAFPGGQADGDESFENCARRESLEEAGDGCTFDGMSELARTRTSRDFEHATYVVPVRDKFEPKLSKEHSDWTWAPVTDLPENTHPAIRATIDRVIGKLADDESEEAKERAEGKLSKTTREQIGSTEHREDMPDSMFLEPKEKKYPIGEKQDGEWKHTRSLLLAAARRARMEGRPDLARRADEMREHDFPPSARAADLALDWSGCARLAPGHTGSQEVEYAYDRESARQYDADGHLHVKDVNIAKASVNEYLGEEIPDWEKLGLDPKKKYRLWRHPDELKRAVPSANHKPILRDHAPIDAESHDPNLVVGSTGTDPRWEPPFVKSSLVFWPAKASREIESNQRRSLSPAYRYRPDMTAGRTPAGEQYDGVMRDISFSHLAQIPEGRQGPDVVVTDAAPGDLAWDRLELALLELTR
jgi:8-oxo-dGTP pyrophosphatase MutT (NUDIX family)